MSVDARSNHIGVADSGEEQKFSPEEFRNCLLSSIRGLSTPSDDQPTSKASPSLQQFINSLLLECAEQIPPNLKHYSIADVVKITGLGRTKIFEEMKAELRHIKIGRRTLISHAELVRWLASKSPPAMDTS